MLILLKNITAYENLFLPHCFLYYFFYYLIGEYLIINLHQKRVICYQDIPELKQQKLWYLRPGCGFWKFLKVVTVVNIVTMYILIYISK